MSGRLVRLAERARAPLPFRLDGADLTGRQGDTVLTAILLSRR